VFRGIYDAPGDDGAVGGWAQVTGVPPPQAIGKVETVLGPVTVMGAGGVVAQVKVGDPVYRHDTIETGANGAVGITFIDGSAFKLSNNARMALNEFVCDGTSNSALFSVSKGIFAFIAGKIAKAGGLRIDTPFARIRGAAQDGGIGILTLAALAFSTTRELQAASRSDAFVDDGTITYKDSPHGTFEITTRDGRVIVADDPGETIVVDPAGSVTRLPNSSSRMAELQQAQQNALSTLSLGLGQQGAAPGGSSTPTEFAQQQLVPINFSQLQNQGPAPLAVTTTTATNPGAIDVPTVKPLPVEIKPVLAADVSGAHAIIELLHTTASTTFDSTPAGEFTFTHFNFSTASASLESITWSGGATLPDGLSAVLASALTTSVSINSTISGTIAPTFSAPDQTFDFLAAGETLTITYKVTVTDNTGASLSQPVTITIAGSNDAPVLAADALGPHTTIQAVQTSGTLIFTDVDLTDQHTASTTVASTIWPSGVTPPSGIDAVLAGALSATTLDTRSGSGLIVFTFGAGDALDFLAAGQKLTITYNVTVTDDSGVSSTQPVTITVIGTNDVPVITSAQTGAVTEHTNVDNSGNLNAAGAITFADVDLTDTHTVTFTPGGSNYLGTFTPTLAQDATGGTTGVVVWTFSVSDKAVEFLGAGQTLTQTYTVLVADNNGGFTTQDVTIIIHGTNEVPVIGGVSTGDVTEDVNVVAGNIFTSGALTITDVDAGQSNFTPQVSTLGSNGHGTFTLAADGTWTYTANDSQTAIQQLGAGQSLTDSFTAVSSDGTASQLVTVTIHGTNDGPVLSDTTDPAAVPELSNASAQDLAPITGNFVVTDLDVGDTLTPSVVGSPTVQLNGSNFSLPTGAVALIANGAFTLTGATSNSGTVNIGYIYDPAAANLDFLRINDSLTITYTVQVNDGTTNSNTLTVTFTITGTNDAPVLDAHSGSLSYTENQAATAIDTAITVFDVDSAQLTGATVKIIGNFVAGQDVLGFTNPNGITGNYNASTGVLTLTGQATVAQYQAALQSVTYFNSSDNPSSQTRTISYQVDDGSAQNNLSNVVTATVAVTPVNDAPVITSGAAAVAVSEEGLPNGVPDTLPNILDTTNSPTASGMITASDADGDPLTMTLGAPSTPLTSGGVMIAWTLQNGGHTLVGKAGATTIITATITDAGAYTVTLTGPIDHPVANQEDIKTFTVPVTVSDGHTTTTTTLSVTIEDDSPKAEPVEVSVDTTDSKTNVMVILDVSGSMDSPSGLPGLTRLDAAKSAVNELLDQYDSRGDVMVRIVTFSTAGTAVGSAWKSVADAKAAIANLSAGGNTNYDAALLTAMTAFTAGTKLSGPGTQNVSYFLSDGEPTTGSDWPQIPGTQSIPGIQDSERGVWESFLTTNNIVSFALGISNGAPQTANLTPIAFDPASGTQLADTPIIVTDLDQLANTLVFTIPPVTGSVLTGAGGATSNSFGADGGFVKSMTVDGVTYTFNPAANGGAGGITTIGGGSFTYNETTKTLTVDTDTSVVGGELAMMMTTGAFTFQPPIDLSSESVGYVLVDGDGDTQSSMLHFSAAVLPAGVAGSPINLGLSDPADHVGPVTVTIAGVPADWTLSEGADNRDGSWTIQASNVSTLSITSPDNHAGAMALQVTMSWTNADGRSGFARATDNVEVFAQGAPIFAWSGDDHLSGSSGKDLFVFSQPIGDDTIHSFNASEDRIDLIGYTGFANFDDVQRHLAQDNAGNAVITLADGQTITLNGVAADSLGASSFVFDQTPVTNNVGTMTISDGAVLPLSGTINNTGIIALDSIGNDTHLELIQHGITLQGGGQVILSDSGENFISGTIPSVTLTNADNTISGAGQLGAGQIALVNDGTIIATGSHALIIDTGANVVSNTGTLEATGSGGLTVNSDVANSGLIWAHGGNITMNGAVTGSGTAMISGTATLGFGAASSVDIIFAADAAGTLTLKDAAGFTGTISGFSSNDQIDLTNSSYSIASVSNATYSSGTNITTLVITDGTSTDAIKLVGDYTTNAAWHFSGDGHGGMLLTDSLPGGSADLAQTVTAALTTQDGTADQFTFQNDNQSGTLTADPTFVVSADPSADAATLDTTSSVSNDQQPPATVATGADTGPTSNVATTPQPSTADSTTSGTQAGATAQSASAAPAATGTNGDTFVFAANFGHETITNFRPETDVIEIDHKVFADFQALLAATHDDGNGNAVITANPNDTITVENVTVAQLVQHQSDFHFT
jgi:T1SS-143 domain-containing protein